MIHLDTHIVVWLSGQQHRRIPVGTRRRIEGSAVSVSPMVALELDVLFEIGKVTRPSAELLDHLEAAIGLTLSAVPFASAVAAARGLGWTRDPFDRLIVGSALAQAVPLVTADEAIRRNYPLAVWD